MGYIFTDNGSSCELIHAPDQHFSKNRPSPPIGKFIRVSADDRVWNLAVDAKIGSVIISVNDSDRPLYLSAEFIDNMSPESVAQILSENSSNPIGNDE